MDSELVRFRDACDELSQLRDLWYTVVVRAFELMESRYRFARRQFQNSCTPAQASAHTTTCSTFEDVCRDLRRECVSLAIYVPELRPEDICALYM